MIRRTLAGALIASTLAVAPAMADGIGIGPHAGYYRNSGADSGDFLFGATVRTKFLTYFGAEASIDYRQDTYAEEIVTARTWPVQVTGLIYPVKVLYGAVGAGWYRTSYDFELPGIDTETSKDFGWHLGGGLEVPLAEAVSLTSDVRWVFLDSEFGELPEAANRDTDFYVITAGVLFGL
jgi:hypothetical protein